MGQSPLWKANRSWTSQEIPHISCNPTVHCRINKHQPPVHILSQFDPVHVSPSHVLKIHFNIILSCTPASSKWSLSLRYHRQNPVYTSPPSLSLSLCLPPVRATYPAHLMVLDFIARILPTWQIAECIYVYIYTYICIYIHNLYFNSYVTEIIP
jgi:hypothetical protein